MSNIRFLSRVIEQLEVWIGNICTVVQRWLRVRLTLVALNLVLVVIDELKLQQLDGNFMVEFSRMSGDWIFWNIHDYKKKEWRPINYICENSSWRSKRSQKAMLLWKKKNIRKNLNFNSIKRRCQTHIEPFTHHNELTFYDL